MTSCIRILVLDETEDREEIKHLLTVRKGLKKTTKRFEEAKRKKKQKDEDFDRFIEREIIGSMIPHGMW